MSIWVIATVQGGWLANVILNSFQNDELQRRLELSWSRRRPKGKQVQDDGGFEGGQRSNELRMRVISPASAPTPDHGPSRVS